MIVTFSPSSDADRYRKHFPFKEGELLENMLNSVALSSKDFYYTTILKCRVAYETTSVVEEVKTCTSNYFLKELEEVKPEVVLALGGDIGKFLVNPKFSITKERGLYHYNGFYFFITYHPRYLLRFPSLEVNSPKWQAWKDLIEFKGYVDNGVPF